MSDPILPPNPLAERAARVLQGEPRLALPLAELLERLDQTDPAVLERRLRSDPRFLVVGDELRLHGLSTWPAADRNAYAAALEQVGLARGRLIVLRERGAETAGLAALVRETTLTLLDHDVQPSNGPAGPGAAAGVSFDTDGFTTAAADAHLAVSRCQIAPGPAAPSTTRPPGPPSAAAGPPAQPSPGRGRPHPAGSRRGSAALPG